MEVNQIILKKKNAVGLAAFHYWHTCPKCEYPWIEEQSCFCAKCGVKIVFSDEGVKYK